jgi:hypothetical protein
MGRPSETGRFKRFHGPIPRAGYAVHPAGKDQILRSRQFAVQTTLVTQKADALPRDRPPNLGIAIPSDLTMIQSQRTGQTLQ